MPRLQEAPNEVRLIVDEIIEKYHAPLRDAELTLDLLFATAKSDTEFFSCLKLHGYACLAYIKITTYKLRAQKHSDAEITIDKRKWEEMSEEEKRALIDHELTHLELKTDKKGALKRDDLGRPVLKMRKHDHQFGFFDCIARRHGKASFEVKQAETFVMGALKQKWLPFLVDAFGTSDGVAITIKAGEEYECEVIGTDGDLAAKVGNHKLMLKAGEFDVIQWVEGEGPKTAKLKGPKVA